MGEELPQRKKIIHHYSFLFAHIKTFMTFNFVDSTEIIKNGYSVVAGNVLLVTL